MGSCFISSSIIISLTSRDENPFFNIDKLPYIDLAEVSPCPLIVNPA